MKVSTREIVRKPHGASDDTRYIPEIRLLAGNLRPRCGESPLDGSRANWPHTPNPRLGCRKNHSKGTLQLATIPLVLLFTISREDDHRSPLQITWSEPTTITKAAQRSSAASKPSRWWQPQRVTRIPQLDSITSATRCLNSMQMH